MEGPRAIVHVGRNGTDELVVRVKEVLWQRSIAREGERDTARWLYNGGGGGGDEEGGCMIVPNVAWEA